MPESYAEQMDRQYNEMIARDKIAAEAGEYVGRYLEEQVADGYAYYTIEGVNEDESFVIEHADIYDGYNIPMYDHMHDCFPRSYALQIISARESTKG